MTTTPEAIRDLVKRLRAMARAEHDDLSIGDEAAALLEQLLEAVEEAERVIGPFADATEQQPGSMPDDSDIDDCLIAKQITFGHLRAAAAWRAKHGRSGQ